MQVMCIPRSNLRQGDCQLSMGSEQRLPAYIFVQCYSQGKTCATLRAMSNYTDQIREHSGFDTNYITMLSRSRNEDAGCVSLDDDQIVAKIFEECDHSVTQVNQEFTWQGFQSRSDLVCVAAFATQTKIH